MLSTAALLSFAMQCAPTVHPDTISDITNTESGLNPFAIAEIVPVKGGASRVISHLPQSKDEALKIVEDIKQKKHRYSVGLMQITSSNFPGFGVTAETMLNPCDNMAVAAKIITDCYLRGGSLPRALSCYYSGNFESGQRAEKAFGNTSYVQRIGYVVPSTRTDSKDSSSDTSVIDPQPMPTIVYPSRVIRGSVPASSKALSSHVTYPAYVVRGNLISKGG